ncbi:MAG: HEPN domain-containing protein [Anaerolineaceae bacterium]|nr:HEPN domain-containing protein [Anaerolineaceae bacterium]
MINEEDRNLLINYRLEQANQTINVSRFLIDSNQLAVAVNRIYYGLYYAVTALAIKFRFETSKHLKLIGWFNKEFISTGILNPYYGKILRNAFQNRTKGDYDAFITFEKEEVVVMHKEMIEFIKTIEEIIKPSEISFAGTSPKE